MRTIASIFAIVLALAIGNTAHAQSVQRIAAVVNEDAISVYDLLARLRMVVLTTNLPDNAQTRNSLAPQILRTLIDERLQLQEAERLSIGVDDEEVAASIKRMESQLQLPEGGVAGILRQANIPISTLRDQVKSQIAWSKVVSTRLRPTVTIGEDEIQNYLETLRANLGKPQFRIGEIFLAVDTPANDVEVRDRARKLSQEIREGARFQAMARQFSESSSAAAGGDIGWIRLDQLQPEIAAVVKTMDERQVSDPIRTNEGYSIIILAGQRNEKLPEPVEVVALQQINLPFGVGASNAEIQSQIELARTVSEVVSGCDDLESAGREMGARVSQRLADLEVEDLTPAMRKAIAGLPTGRASPPVTQEQGVNVVMVCERSQKNGLPSDREVTNQLATAKLNLLARRYMRDLRNTAFVDVRV
ncbi:MAG: hypothetical protein GY791_16680 [Alphaproteobacteria bacterium]|nr:hypothetical protein [Alphaproteobacteria bacterium]